jgi:hypothetical protein
MYKTRMATMTETITLTKRADAYVSHITIKPTIETYIQPTDDDISEFNSIIVNQTVDTEALGKLYKLRNRADFAETDKLKEERAKMRGKKYYSINSTIQKLHSLYNVKKLSTKSIRYSLGNNKVAKAGYGRIYGELGSLAPIWGKLRGTLAHKYYHDVDIVNCHGVLLEQFAKRYLGFEAEAISAYNYERDEYLKRISSDRDEAKSEMNKCFYGLKTTHDILKPLVEETKKIITMCSKVPEIKHLYELVSGLNGTNTKGSFLAYLMQTEERKCLIAMKTAFEELGYEIGALIYDGCLIRKTDDEVDLNKVIKRVFELTGYKIRLTLKDFKVIEDIEDIEAGEDIIEETKEKMVSKKVSYADYLKKKEEFEKTYFYFEPLDVIAKIENNKMMTYTKEHSMTAIDPFYRFQHSSMFDDHTSFVKLWFSDSTKRSCSSMTYRETDDPKAFIRKIEMKYKSYKPKGDSMVPRFMSLLDHVSNKNTVIKEYLIKWFARMVQKPLENAQTAIVVSGDHGVGKDMLGRFIGDFVVGPAYYQNYTDSEQFWEKHDTATEGKVFVKSEEAVGFLAHKHCGRFKARITSESETYNPKGIGSYTCDNLAHFYLTTNEASPVKLERGDRRFFVFYAGNYEKGNHAYWSDLAKNLYTYEAGAEIGAYLETVDISDFIPSAIPELDFRREAMEIEADPVESFIREWDGEELQGSKFFQEYVAFCTTNRFVYVTNITAFGRKLLPFIGNGSIVKRRTVSGIYYSK